MLPSWADFRAHPVDATSMVIEVVRLTELHRSAEVAEKRKRRVDDVARRTEYRKAHGMDTAQGIGNWFGSGAKSDAEALGPAVPVGDSSVAPQEQAEAVQHVEEKKKKFLGIF